MTPESNPNRKSITDSLREINKNLQGIVRQAQADLAFLNSQLAALRALNNKAIPPARRYVVLDEQLSRDVLQQYLRRTEN